MKKYFIRIVVALVVLTSSYIIWMHLTDKSPNIVTYKNACNFKSQSQLQQDVLAMNLLKCKRNGYYVDIGAGDGKKNNNTYVMDNDFGWRGLCIDPFYRNSKARTCIPIKTVVANKDGEKVKFVLAGVLGGIQDDLHAHRARVKKHKVVTFKTRTLKSLFLEHNVPACINYVSLDTEGSEYRILTAFPFKSHCFQVLSVEHNATWNHPKEIEKRQQIQTLLEKNGYRLAKKDRVDDYYVNNNNCRAFCK